jgi:hypothetical protein
VTTREVRWRWAVTMNGNDRERVSSDFLLGRYRPPPRTGTGEFYSLLRRPSSYRAPMTCAT